MNSATSGQWRAKEAGRWPCAALCLCLLWLHTALAVARPQWAADPGKIAYVPIGAPFIFECPPVKDAKSVKNFVVTWTRNQTIWLKVENGRIRVRNTQFDGYTPRRLGAKHVLRAQAAGHRYEFTYDELNGRFRMGIESVRRSDAAVWSCAVEYNTDDNQWVTVSDYRQLNVGMGARGTSGGGGGGASMGGGRPTVTYKHAQSDRGGGGGTRPLSDMVVFERQHYNADNAQAQPAAANAYGTGSGGGGSGTMAVDTQRRYSTGGSARRTVQPNGGGAAGRTHCWLCALATLLAAGYLRRAIGL